MINKILKIKNEKETIKAAAAFARKLKGGEVVALYGDLGAGKTVWVRGMAKGFGIKERISSPTFVLMKCFSLKVISYKSRQNGIPPFSFNKSKEAAGLKAFCHVDAYRLKSSQELLNIGIEDYLSAPNTITVIEWAEKAEELLRGKKVIRINFEFGKKEEERVIEISNY